MSAPFILSQSAREALRGRDRFAYAYDFIAGAAKSPAIWGDDLPALVAAIDAELNADRAERAIKENVL